MVSASCASGTLPGVTLGVGAGGGFGASAAACSSSRSELLFFSAYFQASFFEQRLQLWHFECC